MSVNVTHRLGGAKAALAWKAPCRVATTANITLYGLQTIDGVTLAAEDRVLVKDQTNGAQNGIYRVKILDWVRDADVDGHDDVTTGTRVYVHSGTVGAGEYYLTTTGTITIETTSLTFVPVPAISWVTDVKRYGATGDGVTDDTAAVQAAIDAASGLVYAPPGTYLVGTLTLKEGQFIVGAGQRATAFRARSNSTDVFKYLAATSTRTGFGITDLRIESNGKTGCRAIRIDGNTTGIRCSQVHLHDLVIEGAFAAAISLKYCANTFIGQVFVASAVDGVQIDNCADTDIVNVKVQSGTGYGFYVNGGGGAFDEGVRLVACSTNGQTYGLGVNGQDWGVASGCSFTTCSGGAAILANATNWKFSSCEFAVAGGTPAAAGVSIDSGCVGLSFSSCQLSNSTFGASVAGSKHSFNACYFAANSNVDLYLTNATQVAASANVLDSAGVAWSILEAGTANYNVITGNIGNGTFTTSGAQTVAANNVTY